MNTIATKKSGYKLVQSSIRAKIVGGEWQPGFKLPSEEQLEKEYSLHRLTIIRGLANLAQEGLVVRLRGQGTFVAEKNRQNSVQRRLIKFISPMPLREGVVVRPGVLEGMHQILAQEGYHVGVDFYHDCSEQVELLRRDKDAYHAGFVVWYEPDDRVCQELKRLKGEGYDFVLVDAYPGGLETDYVVTDLVESSRRVVGYLAQAGHKNITYITGRIDRTSLENRLAGFISGLISCDLSVGESSVVKLKNTYNEAGSEIGPAISRLLSGPQRTTALYFSHENLAVEAVKYLRSNQFRVPEDISVIGNDILDPSACEGVALTTVVQDFFEMGKVAGQILLDRLENRTGARPQQIAIKPKLIERKSIRVLNKA
jgi:GntR family transcriptional regulator, arabinose operon transcriptional repressor